LPLLFTCCSTRFFHVISFKKILACFTWSISEHGVKYACCLTHDWPCAWWPKLTASIRLTASTSTICTLFTVTEEQKANKRIGNNNHDENLKLMFSTMLYVFIQYRTLRKTKRFWDTGQSSSVLKILINVFTQNINLVNFSGSSQTLFIKDTAGEMQFPMGSSCLNQTPISLTWHFPKKSFRTLYLAVKHFNVR